MRALQEAGWRENGSQPVQKFRIVTQASYPLAGGEIVTGGRQRWIGPGTRRCTVGARTVCFFEMVDNQPAKFRTYSAKQELPAILAAITSPS